MYNMSLYVYMNNANMGHAATCDRQPELLPSHSSIASSQKNRAYIMLPTRCVQFLDLDESQMYAPVDFLHSQRRRK